MRSADTDIAEVTRAIRTIANAFMDLARAIDALDFELNTYPPEPPPPVVTKALPPEVLDEHPNLCLSAKQVATRLGVSHTTLYKWVKAGRFPKQIQIGISRVAWKAGEVNSWILSRQNADAYNIQHNIEEQANRLANTRKKTRETNAFFKKQKLGKLDKKQTKQEVSENDSDHGIDS